MSYEVLARKWRPRQFDDVIGQEHVTRTLKNALQGQRVAHAYLFVGPRGVGKTSTARIMAKALNCAKGPTPTPCDECDSCREITAGHNLDVLEIDAASNTGVDNVRDLRDNVRYAPARGPFKVYIIDEVHMLSTQAFNALLKTLEEPPAHVKFIFATTEPQKVPATILSRCQRFDLRRISSRDIVRRLAEIAADEKVKVGEDALLAIARGAEGGLRDAESALDQLIASRGKAIGEEDVLAVFGLVARQSLEQLMEAVLKGDVAAAIRLVEEFDRSGKDLQRLVFELLEQARTILICQYTGNAFSGQDLTEAQIEAVRRQAALSKPGRVMRVVEILTETEGRLRYALSRRTLLETGLIRAARAAAMVSLDDILARLEGAVPSDGEGPASEEAPPPASYAVPAPRAATPTVVREVAPPPPGGDLGRLTTQWLDVVERIGHAAPLAKGYLRDAKPLSVTRESVIIGFDPEFADNKDKIAVPRNLKAIQKVLAETLHREVKVEFRVMDAKSTVPGDIKAQDMAGDTPPPAVAAAPKATKRSSRSVNEWVKEPAVKKALELFNGDVVDVRE